MSFSAPEREKNSNANIAETQPTADDDKRLEKMLTSVEDFAKDIELNSRGIEIPRVFSPVVSTCSVVKNNTSHHSKLELLRLFGMGDRFLGLRALTLCNAYNMSGLKLLY